MANTTVNQTLNSFALTDLPVKKSISPPPAETFDAAMKKAQPQKSQSQQQSQKASRPDAKPAAKKASKPSKGKQTHRKSDHVADQDDKDDEKTDGTVVGVEAVTKDPADNTGDAEDAGDQGAKEQKDSDKDGVKAADKTGEADPSKADPLMQAIATADKPDHAAETSQDGKDADAAAVAGGDRTNTLGAAVQKKGGKTGRAAVPQTKAAQVKKGADDSSDDEDSDDAVAVTDDADSADPVATKQAKSTDNSAKTPEDKFTDDPSASAVPQSKTQNAGANQQSSQPQPSDDTSIAAAAAAVVQDLSSNTSSSPADSAQHAAAASADRMTALATDLTSAASAQAKTTSPTAQTGKAAAAPAPQPFMPPEVQFAETNHAKIVTGIQGQLLPGGGTMQIRLDPPEIGALQVSVHMQNGVMTATFQTSNDDATKLLSHSLAQLKHALESQGVSVDKLHVQQSPRDEKGGGEDSQQKQSPSDQSQARQDQQRREILQRMWRRLANGSDPLDMVA